jgi:hypothetical protein
MKLSLIASSIVTAVLASPLGGFTVQNPFGKDIAVLENKNIPGDSPINLCDAESPQLIDIDWINISPNPPLRGQTLNISASATLKTDVEEGSYIEIDVRYGYIRLLKQTLDLCEQTKNVDLECPVKEGHQQLTKHVDLPDEIPPGKYLVIARAFTPNDELLTCLTASVEFPVEG